MSELETLVNEGGETLTAEIDGEVDEEVEEEFEEKVSKKAGDEAGDEASEEAGKKAVKGFSLSKGAKYCAEHPGFCLSLATIGGGGGGLAAYIIKKNKDASKEERACKAVCLPSNWPAYKAGSETTIKYRKIPITDKDGKVTDFPKDEVCQSPTKDCDKFCDKACHVSRSLLNDIPFLGNITDTITDIFTQMFSGPMKYITTGILIAVALAIVVPLFLKMATK